MTKKVVKKVQSPLRVGNAVLIRTVTLYYTGRIVSVTADEILIEDAAWIADTGRYSTALREGALGEIESYPDGVVSIGRGAVIDVADWSHPLPRTVK